MADSAICDSLGNFSSHHQTKNSVIIASSPLWLERLQSLRAYWILDVGGNFLTPTHR